MIHIIGFPVRVGSHFIQRCAWCGEVIEDIDLSLVAAVSSDGSSATWTPWPMGELLDVQPMSRTVVPHKDGDQIPRGCCAFKPHLSVVRADDEEARGEHLLSCGHPRENDEQRFCHRCGAEHLTESEPSDG